MKRLTLMRHANAQWKDPQISDFDRPLNRRGTGEAEAMSRRLMELQLIPTIVLTSSARRAQQTANIVVRELGVPARKLRIDEGLYLAPAEEILRVTWMTGPRIPHLLIVGHNPGITELASLLAPTSHIELTTAAMCSLTFDARIWGDVKADNLLDVRSESPPARLFALWA
ncbi:MAG: SixA phosphatase family protein [Steroidobacteraceae bacterium]